MNASNHIDNCFAVDKGEVWSQAEVIRGKIRHDLANADKSSFLYPVQRFTSNAYQYNKSTLLEGPSTNRNYNGNIYKLKRSKVEKRCI